MSKRKGRSSLSNVSRRAKATKKKRRKAPRSNAALVGNPPIWRDLWEDVVPAAGAYGLTRLAGRCAFKLGKRKSMRFARHVGPWTSVAAAGLTWLGMNYFVSEDTKERYGTPVVIGAFLAALQGLAQTYMPQWGWMLNDYHLDDGAMVPGAGAEPPPNGVRPNGNNTPEAQGQYFEQQLEDDLDAVLNEGETENDLRTGIFS